VNLGRPEPQEPSRRRPDKPRPIRDFAAEQVTGIEPALSAWELDQSWPAREGAHITYSGTTRLTLLIGRAWRHIRRLRAVAEAGDWHGLWRLSGGRHWPVRRIGAGSEAARYVNAYLRTGRAVAIGALVVARRTTVPVS
jgi:hypothetical protein